MTRQRGVLVGLTFCVLVGGLTVLSRSSQGQESKSGSQKVYELRTYTTHEGRLPALHARFRDHTMKLFAKHGMVNGMYWTPVDEAKSQNTLIYVVVHDSMDAAKKSWDGFRNDPEWKKVAAESEKDGKIVAEVESVYMRATDYSPIPK